MTAANNTQRDAQCILASTRFGNVLGSRGSVIPIFREQIRKGHAVTLTDPEMTRFIMSIEEAVRLVIDSSRLARGGEVFVTKMPVIRIKDLAEIMIEELASEFGHNPADIGLKIIGTKPGEKMYEELMNQEETRRALELEKYFAVIPAFSSFNRDAEYEYPGIKSRTIDRPYHSDNELPLTKKQLTGFLKVNNLLYEDFEIQRHPAERYWPNGDSN
jgi:FlaA1/EpsC-like NDP-sugar epimerase